MKGFGLGLNRQLNGRVCALGAAVLIAAMLRLVPHAPNFSPIAAMALFGGAYFSRKSLAFILPLAAMFLSDCVLGFHDQMVAVYAAFVLVTMIGFALNARGASRSVRSVGVSTVAGSLVFFTVTNFAVWMSSGMYARSAQGLLTCFVAALPFLQNAMVGDAVFAAALFGGWVLVEKSVPALQDA